VRLLEGDQAAGELQQGAVVLGLLRPADEQGAVAIQPGVGGLDDPAPGAPARDAQPLVDLRAATYDVRLKATAIDQLTALGVVVAPVQTDALRRLGRGLWPRDGDRVESGLQQFVVVAVGALVGNPERDAGSLAENRAS